MFQEKSKRKWRSQLKRLNRTMAADIAALFSSFNVVLEAEAKRREDITTAVKEIGARSRAITAALQGAHKSEGIIAQCFVLIDHMAPSFL